MTRRRRRRRAVPRDPGTRYVLALDKLTAAEKSLARAFAAWERARRELAAAERALDRAQAAGEGAP